MEQEQGDIIHSYQSPLPNVIKGLAGVALDTDNGPDGAVTWPPSFESKTDTAESSTVAGNSVMDDEGAGSGTLDAEEGAMGTALSCASTVV